MRAIQSNVNAFLFTPNKYFSIPIFQRPYSWDVTNIYEFLDDLEKVKTTKQNHYFGSIVYITGHESIIIDGQQRATTALLMITAIYHLVSEDPSKSATPAEQINEQFLYNKYGEEENRLKLRTVTTDNEIFEKIYQRKIKNADDKVSKLYKAYIEFYEYFKNKTDLHEYIDALENLEIVDISIDHTDDNPQKIFESINSTGKPLSDGDKIRNFALMLSNKPNMEYVYEEYWKKIENRLTTVTQEFISDFFKNYLTSYLQKEFKLDQVYPGFKRQFDQEVGNNHQDKAVLDAFYGTIMRYLEAYLCLKMNSCSEDVFTEFKNQIFRINYLNYEVVYPFLMRVLLRFADGELTSSQVKAIFGSIETYLVRRILCSIPSTGLNKFFADLDKDIVELMQAQELTFADYTNILNYLFLDKAQALRYPRDSEVINNIPKNQFYLQKKSNVFFILSSIDDIKQSKESFLLRELAGGKSQLSIEHIMPQTLNAAWIKELGNDHKAIHEDYLHTLPNLTLTGYNPKYSNRSFTDKLNIENGFMQSPLLINSFIKKFEHWQLDSITQRTTWWSKQITDIWPLPQTSFVPPKTDRSVNLLAATDLTGAGIKNISMFGDTYRVGTWSEALDTIVEQLTDRYENWQETVLTDPYLAKYISNNSSQFASGYEINDSGYFVETGINTNRKLQLIKKLCETLGYNNIELNAELTSPAKQK